MSLQYVFEDVTLHLNNLRQFKQLQNLSPYFEVPSIYI